MGTLGRVTTRHRLASVLLACSLMGGACGDDPPGDSSTPSSDGSGSTAPGDTSPGGGSPTTAPAASAGGGEPQALDSLDLELTRVATVTQPVDLAVRTGDDALYVVEKTGRVQAVRAGGLDPVPVLDLSEQVSTGGEQGLLGLTFSPDGARLYVNYTDTGGDTRIVEYRVAEGRADPATARELLKVAQPYANHNGGHLAFGPDGKLWIGLGDGGSGNDPQNRAQNLGDLLGKLLRIDPTPSATTPYTIPPDNPFVGQAGARGEIWSSGLRNPWRFSFDRSTGDLWIGDVGQNAVEEVDFAPGASKGGENWGWPALEGNRANKGAAPAGAVAPILDYDQDDGGCSVVGGYVYRGSRIPGLAGAYLYGDYCRGNVAALRQSDGRVAEESDLGLEVDGLSSFGEDAAGELYALSLDGSVYRIDAA